ncbi:MAG: SpoIVB peptidase [Oscillospiraceae bacterium]|nr:SpoIVB peptidase [Oscillospiraceae bacterium]
MISMLLCVVIGFYYVNLPDKYYLCDSNSFKINAFFDITAVNPQEQANSSDIRQVFASEKAVSPASKDIDMELKLMGIFPIKKVKAEQITRPQVIPCGTPFGIKIITGGAIVTEFGEVDTEEGFTSPVKNEIKIGDVIIKVNGVNITQNNDIAEAVQHSPDKATVIFVRDGKVMETEIVPVKSKRDGLYKIGVWVRDSSAGIGTMTFYNPENATFAGLGHAVCDVDTGQVLPLLSGEVVSVYVSGVTKGFPGAPGELCGAFMSRVAVGTIKSNTDSGVFGVMESPPAIDGALEMSFKQEVQIGPAKILTTIDGNSPKEYDVIIEKIDYSDKNKVKNMVIRVTDKSLLNKTGGIVQGMSGSPIIQNGRLAGAVTHVFVSDPARGYAIFAENMYREATITGTDFTENENTADYHELQDAA